MADLKKIQKSVRLTEYVYKVVDEFEGNGFNEKFQNFVLYAVESENERKSELRILDEKIAEREKQLKLLKSEVEKAVRSLQVIDSDISNMIYKSRRF